MASSSRIDDDGSVLFDRIAAFARRGRARRSYRFIAALGHWVHRSPRRRIPAARAAHPPGNVATTKEVHMSVKRTWLALAVAFVATMPVALAAQGAATKSDSAKKTTSAAKKTTSSAAQKSAGAPTTTAAAQAPAAATQAAAASTAKESAKCKDGSMYSGASRQGACSSHGGVAEWLTGSKGTAPKGATAKCNDGTYYTKAEHQGACSGHKGVAEWLKK